MGKWSLKTVDDVCEVLDNKRIPVSSLVRENMKGDIPYYGANGLVGFIDKYIFDEELILIAEDGGNFEQFENKKIAYKIQGKSWVNNHAHILRSKQGYNQNYIFYCLEHKNILNYIAGGTRSKLNQKELKSISFHTPDDLDEQEKIADILNEVDVVIDKTRKLIDKYKCVKEGLLQDLLNNGIDGGGKIRSPKTHAYKESPLGLIPAEWECVGLETTCRVYSGSTPKTNEIENWEGDYIWLTPNDLSKQSTRNIYNSERKLTREGILNSTGRLLPVNSIIVSSRAPVGYCAVVKKEFSFNQGCKGLVIKENNDFDFYYYLLSTCKSKFELVSSGTTFLELSKKELQRFKIAKPCLVKEQREIAKQLIAIDDRIQTEEKYLYKMLSIKKGLIQDLLNQKISVDCLL